jgi:hypothetical protein
MKTRNGTVYGPDIGRGGEVCTGENIQKFDRENMPE